MPRAEEAAAAQRGPQVPRRPGHSGRRRDVSWRVFYLRPPSRDGRAGRGPRPVSCVGQALLQPGWASGRPGPDPIDAAVPGPESSRRRPGHSRGIPGYGLGHRSAPGGGSSVAGVGGVPPVLSLGRLPVASILRPGVSDH